MQNNDCINQFIPSSVRPGHHAERKQTECIFNRDINRVCYVLNVFYGIYLVFRKNRKKTTKKKQQNKSGKRQKYKKKEKKNETGKTNKQKTKQKKTQNPFQKRKKKKNTRQKQKELI